jgi:hypothetical protein
LADSPFFFYYPHGRDRKKGQTILRPMLMHGAEDSVLHMFNDRWHGSPLFYEHIHNNEEWTFCQVLSSVIAPAWGHMIMFWFVVNKRQSKKQP